MAIKTEIFKSKSSEYLSGAVDRVLSKKKIDPAKVGKSEKQRLQLWIMKNTFGKSGNFFDSEGMINPLLPKDVPLKVPSEFKGLMDIMKAEEVAEKDLGLKLVRKVEKPFFANRTVCFNYANGGARYEFYLEKNSDGITEVKYNAQFPDGRREGGLYGGGQFHTFRNVNGKRDAGDIRTRAFNNSDENIEIEKIHACNDRVFACGQDKNKKYRFFWSQMEDSFPDELLGVCLPGTYVTKVLDESLDDKKYADVIARFDGTHKDYNYKKHPTWAIQALGGRVELLLASLGNILLGSIPDFIKGVAEKITKKAEEEAVKKFSRQNVDFVKEKARYVEDVVESFPPARAVIEWSKSVQDGMKRRFEQFKNYLNGFDRLIDTMPIIVKKGQWYEICIDFDPSVKIEEILAVGASDIERYETYTTDHGGEVQCWVFDNNLEDFSFNWSTKIKTSNVLDWLVHFCAEALDGIDPADFVVTGGKILMTLFRKFVVNPSINQLFQSLYANFFPNFTIVDGMGFNDGTCNFFVLARIMESDQEQIKVFWCDEQEGFSERWRTLDPWSNGGKERKFEGLIGKLSLFSAIEWYYNGIKPLYRLGQEFFFSEGPVSTITNVIEEIGDYNRLENFFEDFYKSLPYAQLDKNSHMAVSRFPVLVTSDKKIYSVSFMWGVSDFRWNARPYPKAGDRKYILFPQCLRIREDLTVCLPALQKEGETYKLVYFYQKYLPQHMLGWHFAHHNYSYWDFKHEWRMVNETTFKAMDSYYNFGIYDAYDEKYPGGNGALPDNWFMPLRRGIRKAYAFQGIDQRSQYYEVKITDKLVNGSWKPLSSWELKEISEMISKKPIEWEPALRVFVPFNPFFTTYGIKNKLDEEWVKEPVRKELALKISLRWDHVKEKFVALFAHPRDDDISVDMERDGTISEYDFIPRQDYKESARISDIEIRNQFESSKSGKDMLNPFFGAIKNILINRDLSGPWRPVGSGREVSSEVYDSGTQSFHKNYYYYETVLKPELIGTIFFQPNKSEFVNKFEQEKNLDKVAKAIYTRYKHHQFDIIGHVALVKDPEVDLELQLSNERASKVYDLLLSRIDILIDADKNISRPDLEKANIRKYFDNCKGIGSQSTKNEQKSQDDMHKFRKVEILAKDLENAGSEIYKIEFVKRVKSFSGVHVAEARIKKTSGNQVEVSFTTYDHRLRYVTVGAVIKGVPQRISVRTPLAKNLLQEIFQNIEDFTNIELTPIQDFISNFTPIKIKVNLLREFDDSFFEPGSHETTGLSVWFEDMFGHKNTPETLIIE